jgi:hypothetical protein
VLEPTCLEPGWVVVSLQGGQFGLRHRRGIFSG